MIIKSLNDKKLILSSSSPRRKFLMEGLDLSFSVEVNQNISEDFDPDMNIELVPEYLANIKSNGFGRKLEDNEILITADTMVLCNGEILGKPKDKKDASCMLRMLSDNMHKVLTGVCIRDNQKTESFTSTTDVYFKVLTEAEIEYYIDKYSPYDKAGAYGAQEWIGYVAIEKIDGSYFNVMGLPIQRLYSKLEEFLSD